MRTAKPGEKRWGLIKTGRLAMPLPQFIGYLVKFVIGIFFLNLRDAFQNISKTARRLIDSCREVEPRFLKMGRVLQAFYADLNTLIHRVKEITSRLAGTGEENLLEKAAELSGEASRVLDRYCLQASANFDSVGMLIDHLKALRSACDQIDRIATNLRVVGINIGVECTRSEDAREMFRTVAEEIITFSDDIVSVGRQIREDAREACVHEETTREKIFSGLIELRELSRDAADTIDASVKETNCCIDVARDVFDESGRRFEEISCQVEEIVAAVQFHDSMRQRLEHVSAALAEVGGQVVGRQGLHGATVFRMSRLGAAYGVMTVQTGQIRDVIGEIERVHGKSVRAFEKMKTETELLVQGMTSVCNMGTANGGDDPFVRLIASLEHLVSLIHRADELVAVIGESIARAADIAKRFSRHLRKVEKIGVETHFKAINAIIKSDHLGSGGRTLEVLAQEMNAISRETDLFVVSMKKSLKHVSDFAETLQCTSKEHAAGFEFDGQWNGGSEGMHSKSIEEISAAQAGLKKQVKGVASEAGRLISGIRNTLNELVFLPSLADEMTRHLEQLERASASLRHFDSGTQTVTNSNTARLTDAYTMKRERDVHETIVAGDKYELDQVLLTLTAGGSGGGPVGSFESTPTKSFPVEEDKNSWDFEKAEAFGENVELF